MRKMKICSKCKEEKEEGEFSKSKSRKGGLNHWCKICCKKYTKKWYENNKERIRKQHKEYYKNNKDKRKEYRENNKAKRKEYRENNKDKMRKYHKEYCKNNKDKRREYITSFALYNTYEHQISYAELTRHDPDNWELLQVKCTYCSKWFNPTNLSVYNRKVALERPAFIGGENRLYCSNGCKQLCPIFHKKKYSAEQTNTKQLSREVQAELRQMVFERDEWTCIKCGKTKSLQCHHIEGIHWNPIESADIDICVTFCVKCHGEAHKDKGCRYYDLQCRMEE
uniref:Putative HNH homing endonuclease n=1 Tax=viral metagenome TaxID=1070528 RepID=A0A6M3XU54_9ZZZZ